MRAMAGTAMGMFAATIQARGREDKWVKARMATIRSHAGPDITTNPQLWGVAIACLSSAVTAHNRRDDVEDRWVMPSLSDAEGSAVPTKTETAIAGALSIYAAQYGTHVPAPHVRGKGFGAALKASTDPDDKGMERAMRMLFSSDSADVLIRRLIEVVPRMGIGFDYGALADDLVRFQKGPQGRTAVIAAWSRQYCSETVGSVQADEQKEDATMKENDR